MEEENLKKILKKEKIKDITDYEAFLKKVVGKARIRYDIVNRESNNIVLKLMINEKVVSQGQGKSKKEAKKSAIVSAYCNLVKY